MMTRVSADILSAQCARVGMSSPLLSASSPSSASSSDDDNTEEYEIAMICNMANHSGQIFTTVILKLTPDRAATRRQLKMLALTTLTGKN